MRMKSHHDLDDLDPMIEELRGQDQLERQRRANLLRHPDCRDPDHLGCEHCEESEDNE